MDNKNEENNNRVILPFFAEILTYNLPDRVRLAKDLQELGFDDVALRVLVVEPYNLITYMSDDDFDIIHRGIHSRMVRD